MAKPGSVKQDEDQVNKAQQQHTCIDIDRETTDEHSLDEESGRTTQRMVHPMSLINWEPPVSQEAYTEESSINNKFNRFEHNVLNKRSFAWDDWSKIRSHIPGEIRDVVRAIWETYWNSPGMGPEPFSVVMSLVRRKIGLPFSQEILHKLQSGNVNTDSDEQAEPALQEVLEDGQVRDGDKELGEIRDE